MLEGLPQAFCDAAFERSAEAVLVVDDSHRIVAANDAARALMRAAPKELHGKSLGDFDDPNEAPSEPSRVDPWKEVERGRAARYERTMVLGDGALRVLEVSVSGNVLPHLHLLFVRDVTERRRREVMSERYQLLSRHMHDIVLFIARDGHIVEANDAAAAAYGYSHDDLLTLRVHDLRDPSTLADVGMQMQRAFETGTLFETMHRRRNGTPFPVEVGSRSALIGGEVVLLSVIRDITERRQLHARLLHADRLSTFGVMAAGIAHEINNPLAYAMTNLEVLSRRLASLSVRARGGAERGGAELGDSLEECGRILQVAQEGMARVRGIVRDLRFFSHADADVRTWVDLRIVLESSVNVARGEIRHRAHVTRDYRDVPLVEANGSRLGQVFLNLLVNAAQSIPEGRGGNIHVTTSTDRFGRPMVEVIDDGCGIAPELMARLFEPFLTTKRAGEGTGLGLYIAHNIVESMGGDLSVESMVNGGTTMRVTLPKAEPPPRDEKAPNASREPVRARILVVDDEVTIGLTLSALLAQAHEVVVTSSGQEALETLSKDPAFDVLLCDVMMPGMSGVQLYQRIEQRWPSLRGRMLFMTGGTSSPEARRFLEREAVRWLQKPFSTEELESALAAVMRSNQPS